MNRDEGVMNTGIHYILCRTVAPVVRPPTICPIGFPIRRLGLHAQHETVQPKSPTKYPSNWTPYITNTPGYLRIDFIYYFMRQSWTSKITGSLTHITPTPKATPRLTHGQAATVGPASRPAHSVGSDWHVQATVSRELVGQADG